MLASNRRIQLFTLLFAVGLIAILVMPLATHRSLAGPAGATGDSIAFAPAALPVAGPELSNSDRGLFKWNGQESPYIVPLPEPAPDVYHRYTWRDIEPTKDHYDFAKLDALAAEAQARGGKFMFKIYSFCTAWCPGVSVPDYFLDRGDPDYLAKGWYYGSAYVPDWNDPHFLARTEKLLNVLGQRYGNDARLGVVEIGIFGNWGEWHTWPLSYPSPTGAEPMTTEHQKLLIDMHARAFPTKQLVMLRGGAGIADAMNYAMSLSGSSNPAVARPIGWAAHCWGDPDEENDIVGLPQWPAMKDRWKTAPVMGEICGTLDASSANWPVLPQHVKDYHIAMLGNGNIGGDSRWDGLPASAQQQYLLAGKLAGYRYSLNSMAATTQPSPGASFTVTSAWSNAGVAPVYEPWDVMLQLRVLATGQVAWEGRSAIDLRNILPDAGGPQQMTDTFTLPANLPAGSYNLALVIRDTTTGYRRPMALAIAGRSQDGSYQVGTIRVAEPGSAPTATATAIPTSASSPSVAPPSPTAPAAGAVTYRLKRQVASSNNDAEENLRDGYIDLGSSDLELTHDPTIGRDQAVGVRFENISIPKGARVLHAYLKFTAKEAQDEITSLRISAQAAPNPASFDMAASGITARARARAQVSWPNIPAWLAGRQYKSPELSAMIQELVNQDRWASGNAVVFIIEGSGHRTAWSYDGNPAGAVSLSISYTMP